MSNGRLWLGIFVVAFGGALVLSGTTWGLRPLAAFAQDSGAGAQQAVRVTVPIINDTSGPVVTAVDANAIPRVTAIHGGYSDPIVTYDAFDKRLVVTAHAPRDLLICIRDVCDLAEGWRLK